MGKWTIIFQNERKFFFERLKKKLTKCVVHERWTIEMKKVEHAHLRLTLASSLVSTLTFTVIDPTWRVLSNWFPGLVSWFGFLVFKSTLRQSKAWIKGLKGTVVNRWCLSENTGSHKSLTIASWNRMTPSAVCLADSSVGGSGERHSFLTSEQRFNYSLTQSLEDNERIYKMSSWLFSINLSNCKINQ